MRVGLLTSDLSAKSGWANYCLNLVQQLKARGIETTVICARNSPPVDFDIQPVLPTVTPPERHSLIKSLRQLPRLRQLTSQCDIIHSAIEPYAILAAALARDKPLFVTLYGSYANLPRMRRFPVGRLYHWAFQRAQLICISQYTAKVTRRQLPNARMAVINPASDWVRFAEPSPVQVQKRGPTVVAVGEIKPRKGTLELVEAMALVREKIPEAQCLIMGNPQYGSAYTALAQQRIKELQLEDTVHIMGFVADDRMRAWLAAADVFALPAMDDGYNFEGFGLVLLEASASGTAVIGTDQSGTADAILHGETGLIVSQADIAESLPRALIELLGDPAKAKRMGAAGRSYARTQTWDAVADQIIALYAAALA